MAGNSLEYSISIVRFYIRIDDRKEWIMSDNIKYESSVTFGYNCMLRKPTGSVFIYLFNIFYFLLFIFILFFKYCVCVGGGVYG